MEKNVFDQPVKNNKATHENIIKNERSSSECVIECSSIESFDIYWYKMTQYHSFKCKPIKFTA